MERDDPGPCRWTPLPSAEAVAQRARDRILQRAQAAITERGAFHLVLAGGGTPERCYRLLQHTPADWGQWHIWFGDERCLPPDHPQRNSRMASDALLDRVPIPRHQIHPIPAELGPTEAARRYRHEIAAALPFDLVLLGLGEDGHTASLFPGQRHPDDALVVPVTCAPKPPPERVSLNYPALQRSNWLLFLVTGAGKGEAVAAWRAGRPLPAARVRPQGPCEILLDAAAWDAALRNGPPPLQ